MNADEGQDIAQEENTGSDARVWIADGLTLANGLFGFAAILTWLIELGPFKDIPNAYVAAAYIGLGVAADGVDGIAARRWGSTGLGESLDSMSDILTFSVAPAVFLVMTIQPEPGTVLALAAASTAVVLIVAGMLRLARHQTDDAQDHFVGLPAPWSGATLVALLLFGIPAWGAIAAALVLAALNLSPVPYPKTRGPYVKATLFLSALTVIVITLVLVLGEGAELAFWAAVIVAISLVALAPLFADT